MTKILSVLPLIALLASLTGAPVLDANGSPIPTTCTTNFVVGALDTNSAAPMFEIASLDGVVDPSPNYGLLLVGPSVALSLAGNLVSDGRSNLTFAQFRKRTRHVASAV